VPVATLVIVTERFSFRVFVKVLWTITTYHNTNVSLHTSKCTTIPQLPKP